MTTKNLVPRLDGQGKLGVKGASNLKWKEVNALSGSFDLGQIDDLQNQDGNDLIVGGTGVTVTHASGSNGFEYTIASTVDLTGYATENYVNDAIQGLDAKEAVDAATTGTLSGYGYASNVFTETTPSGALTIDGFALSNGDRVLVKDQGSGDEVQHGIYVVSNVGSSSSAVTLTRAPDITHADTDADDFDGAFVFVLNGTDQIGRSYVAKPTTAGQTTVGTHGMTWVTFTSSNVTTLNTLSDVNASSAAGIDGYSLVYNHSNTQWEASEIISAGPTVLLDSNNVSHISGTNRAEITVTAGSSYIIDESVDNIQFLTYLVFVLPNANVNDPSTTKIVNLTSLPVFIFIDTGNSLYDALGNTAPATTPQITAGGKTGGYFFKYTKGTINLYQSDISSTNAKWYSYFDYPVKTTTDISEGDGVSYSVQDLAFINAGHIYGEYTLTSNITADNIRSSRKYVTAHDETTVREVEFGNSADNEAAILALDGSNIYFENRGSSTIVLTRTQTELNSVFHRSEFIPLGSTSNFGSSSLTLRPGESAVIHSHYSTQIVSAGNPPNNFIINKLLYRKLGYNPDRVVETDNSATNTTIEAGTELHKLIYVDNGSTPVTMTVPESAVLRDGYELTLKVLGTGAVTVARSGSNTFDGNISITLSEHGQLTLIKSASGWAILQSGSVSGITEVSQDSSPQLGGDLDLNGQDLVTTANADLELAPHGTGVVVLKGNQTGGNNPGAIKLNCEQNSHGVTIKSPDHSSSANYTLTLPINDGDADQVLKTDGSGVLSWVDQSGGSITVNSLTDVSAASPQNYDALYYDSSASTWRSGNLNTRSITSTDSNVAGLTSGNGTTTVTVSDFDKDFIWWPDGTRSNYTFVLPDLSNYGSGGVVNPGHVKPGQRIRIACASMAAGATITLQLHSGNSNYIYPSGKNGGAAATPAAPSVSIPAQNGFIEVMLYDNAISGAGPYPNWMYTCSGEISVDATPQLGGDLDLNGNKIVTVSNAALSLAPHGSGVVTIEGNATGGSGALKLNCEQNSHGVTIKSPTHTQLASTSGSYTLTLPTTNGTQNQLLQTDGNGVLSWATPSSGISSVQADTAPRLGGVLNTNGNQINLNMGTSLSDNYSINRYTGVLSIGTIKAGNPYVNIYNSSPSAGTTTFSLGKGTVSNGQVISSIRSQVNNYTTDSNNIIYNTIETTTVDTTSGSEDASTSFKVSANGSLTEGLKISANGSVAQVRISDAFSLPTTDGSANQVLETDGSGVLSWVTPSSGISNVVEDTTPQLGGNLDVQSRSITTSNSNGNINFEPVGSGHVLIGANGAKSTPPEIRFYSESGTAAGNYVGLKGPTDTKIGANITFELPSGYGNAGEVLETDGNGILSWTSVSGGGGGGSSYTYSAITANTTAQAWYHYSVDTSGGAVTLNLPALSGLTNGDEIRVKLRDATNTLTIDANSTETIDGSTTFVLSTAYASVTLVAGSTEWEIV